VARVKGAGFVLDVSELGRNDAVLHVFIIYLQSLVRQLTSIHSNGFMRVLNSNSRSLSNQTDLGLLHNGDLGSSQRL
jgi:hypothetical protein